MINVKRLYEQIFQKGLFFCIALAGILFNSFPALAVWMPHNSASTYSPISTKETDLSDQDSILIRRVISGQLEAFRLGDGDKAFSYASPGIKQQFETPAQFFTAVKSAYDSVLISRSIVFEDLKQVMGIVTQPVLFLASNGDTVIGSYIMEKQDNGDWKISGCYLAPMR